MTLVIGCYTQDTAYEEEAELLAASLDAVGMHSELTGYRSRGDWYANTAHKAEYLRAQRSNRQGPLLYVDVDTFFHDNCEAYFDRAAERGHDFGAHFWRGPAKGHDFSQIRERGWWLISSTLFLGDTSGCRRLLDNWCALNSLWRRRGILEGGGQKNLWFTLTCMDGLNVLRLPNRFNYIFDKSPTVYPDEPCIIEHTIASREHRDAGAGRISRKRQRKLRELREQVRGV